MKQNKEVTKMEYTKHQMEFTEFEENDAYVRADMSNAGSGSSAWSIKPDRSDA